MCCYSVRIKPHQGWYTLCVQPSRTNRSVPHVLPLIGFIKVAAKIFSYCPDVCVCATLTHLGVRNTASSATSLHIRVAILVTLV